MSDFFRNLPTDELYEPTAPSVYDIGCADGCGEILGTVGLGGNSMSHVSHEYPGDKYYGMLCEVCAAKRVK